MSIHRAKAKHCMGAAEEARVQAEVAQGRLAQLVAEGSMDQAQATAIMSDWDRIIRDWEELSAQWDEAALTRSLIDEGVGRTLMRG